MLYFKLLNKKGCVTVGMKYCKSLMDLWICVLGIVNNYVKKRSTANVTGA